MRTTLAALAMILLAIPTTGAARDDRLKFSIKDAITTPAAQAKLTSDVSFYFGDVAHPAVEKDLGETIVKLAPAAKPAAEAKPPTETKPAQ